jgi:hypothetical protein
MLLGDVLRVPPSFMGVAELPIGSAPLSALERYRTGAHVSKFGQGPFDFLNMVIDDSESFGQWLVFVIHFHVSHL